MDAKVHPIIQAYIDGNAFGETLGMDFELREPGSVAYFLTVAQKHLATPKAAHGGVLAAFADAILGVGALSLSSASGNVVSTVEFKINYLAPALLGDELTGMSRLLKAGRSLIFMEGEIKNQRNELVATASGTFNQYPVEKLFKLYE